MFFSDLTSIYNQKLIFFSVAPAPHSQTGHVAGHLIRTKLLFWSSSHLGCNLQSRDGPPSEFIGTVGLQIIDTSPSPGYHPNDWYVLNWVLLKIDWFGKSCPYDLMVVTPNRHATAACSQFCLPEILCEP